jgi:tellurite resistance protein TehA-like permease
MENDLFSWILILSISIVVFFVMLFAAKWVFSVNKHIKYQETIIKLLAEIALKDGVYKETVNEILSDANRAA